MLRRISQANEPKIVHSSRKMKEHLWTFIFPVLIITSNCVIVQRPPSNLFTVEFNENNNKINSDTEIEGITNNQIPRTTEHFKFYDNIFERYPVENRVENRAVIYAQSKIKLAKSNHRKDAAKLVNKWEEHVNKKNDIFSETTPKKLVCYYNVPTYQDRPFAVFPEQIDPHLCTHIILGFAGVYNDTIQPSNLKDLEFYNRTLGLRKSNANLKVMLTVGGAGNSSQFHDMVRTNSSRAKFISSCMSILKQFPFDGMDFDWEFPAWPGPLSEKDQFLGFLQEFRKELGNNGKSDFILSAAVASPKAIADLGYDIPGMAKVVDFVNLMTYDFHFYSPYSPFTGPNAPLFAGKEDIGLLGTLNTAWAAKYWYQNGMPANKIIVGVPTYGHTWRLVDERQHGYMALAGDYGCTGVRGFAGYPEICEFLQRNGTQYVFDNETQVPYAFNEREWISFDNEQSAIRKAEWVNEFDFGGVMMYCINNDDAWKMCNSSQVSFPIISAVKKTLQT